MSSDEAYNKKLESLQQYIPFLNSMIIQLKDPRKKNREQQLAKMVSLHSMITDKKRKLKLETLIKCEDVILKLYDKVKSNSGQPLLKPIDPAPITPSSPSPPPNLPLATPVMIPTEKVESFSRRSSSLDLASTSVKYDKPKIDIYASAVVNLKPHPKPMLNLTDPLKSDEIMSKPPISLDDLKDLQDDDTVETLSLLELNDLKKQLKKQLKDDNKVKVANTITVKQKNIMAKKPIEQPKQVKTVSAPVKVVKETNSIFGSALSSIDHRILESSSKHKERRSSSDKHKKTIDHHKSNSSKKESDKRHPQKETKRSSPERTQKDASKPKEATKPVVEKKIPPEPPTYKRLADKYNPKPRKPSIETPPIVKVVPTELKRVSVSPTKSIYSPNSIESDKQPPLNFQPPPPLLPPPVPQQFNQGPNFWPKPQFEAQPEFYQSNRSIFMNRPPLPVPVPDSEWRTNPNWPNSKPAVGLLPIPVIVPPVQNQRFQRDPRNFASGRRDSRESQPAGNKQRDPRINRCNTPVPITNHIPDDKKKNISPLDSLYCGNSAKTGKGYGIQNFKIPKKIKKEDDEPQPDLETPAKIEESVDSTNVSSSTEIPIGINESIPESNEITSTNDLADRSATPIVPTDDANKPKDTNQTDIINQFLKKLLEDSRTQKAATSFIETVSHSLHDDEKLKQIVETVQTNKEEKMEKEKMKELKAAEAKRKKRLKMRQLMEQKKREQNKMKAKKVIVKKVIKKVVRKIESDVESDEEQEEEVIKPKVGRKKSRVKKPPPKIEVEPKKTRRKHRKYRTELDLLHEDIQEMYIRDGVLTATGIRNCRVPKIEKVEKTDSVTTTTTTTSNESTPTRPKRKPRKSEAAKLATTSSNSDKLKQMSDVRVLVTKLPIDQDLEETRRYLLRRGNKNKSYVENENSDCDEERNERNRKQEEAEQKVVVVEEKKIVEKKVIEEKPIEEKPIEEEPVRTKRPYNRKKTGWASGIIPKRKRKVSDTSSKDALELVEPDRNYFTGNWYNKLACKLCEFHGRHITNHYKFTHPESEILSSRLRPKAAEEAINESIKLNLDDAGEIAIKASQKYNYKCRFCDYLVANRSIFFYDHITIHTGEYRHRCGKCSFSGCNSKCVYKHFSQMHPEKERDVIAVEPPKGDILGWMCLDCHYVQLSQKAVENHVNIYHLGDGKKMIRIFLSSVRLPDFKPKKIGKKTEETESITTTSSSVQEEEEMEEDEEEEEEEDVVSIGADDDIEDLPMIEHEDVDLGSEEVKEPEIEEQPVVGVKRKNDDAVVDDEKAAKVRKVVDMTVFTCQTSIGGDDDDHKIKDTLTEINEPVKINRSSNFIDQLTNRLMNNDVELTIEKDDESTNCSGDDMELEVPNEEVKIDEIIQHLKIKLNDKISQTKTTSNLDKPNVFIKDIIQKLRGNLGENEPPPLAPISNELKPNVCVSFGLLNLIRNGNEIEYACRVPSCRYSTTIRDEFVKHWQDGGHQRYDSNIEKTDCLICLQTICKNGGVLNELWKHIENCHFIRNENDELDLDQMVASSDVKDRSILKPKLTKDEKEDGKKKEEEEEEEEEDNPFGFKICDVVSLATDDPNPQKEVPKPAELKEIKLKASDRTLSWKCPIVLSRFLKFPNDLYKCPQFYCNYVSSNRKLFDNHVMKLHVESSGDDYVVCVYCDVKTLLSQSGLHMDLRHLACLFACSICLYRAIMKECVQIHLKKKHAGEGNIVEINNPGLKTGVGSKLYEFQPYPVQQCCPAFSCQQKGCDEDFLFRNEFIVHLIQKHCSEPYECGFRNSKCNFVGMKLCDLISHWEKQHQCFIYYCLYCKFGSGTVYKMLEHYADVHPGLEPMVVSRKDGRKDCQLGYAEAFSKITYLSRKALKDSIEDADKEPSSTTPQLTMLPLSMLQPQLQQPLQNQQQQQLVKSTSANSKKFIAIISSPNNVQRALPLAINQPKGTIPTITTTPALSVPKKPEIAFVSTDDNPSPSSSTTAATLASPKKISNESIAKSPEKDTDPLSFDLSETSTNLSSFGDDSDSLDLNGDEKGLVKKTGLLSYQLYRCAFCVASFSNSKLFKFHASQSKTCQDMIHHPTKPLKCVHCYRYFKNAHSLVEHIMYHGQTRFQCSLCEKKGPAVIVIKLHMKNKHGVTGTIITPLNALKTNLETDEFVLRPKPIDSPTNPTTSTTIIDPLKDHPYPSFQKITFKPSEIAQIPNRNIFSYELKCALCAFTSKVRMNLVRHLELHIKDKNLQIPSIAPVNPVPCLEKNEKMFDKMTNLAISSFTGRMGATSTTKPKKSDAIDDDKQPTPEYVPSHRRYVCCANACNYLCPEEANLRAHLYALHSNETNFACPHCKTPLKNDIDYVMKHFKYHDLLLYRCAHAQCNFVHYLRHKVEQHANGAHFERQLQEAVQVVRQLEAKIIDGAEVLNDVKTINIKVTTIANQKLPKPWYCGICKYRAISESVMRIHIQNKHELDKQFKCTLCVYKSDDKATFKKHFSVMHPDCNVDIIDVYYKIDIEVNQAGGASANASGEAQSVDTTPLWQRDRPRVRHIRGILFDDALHPTKMKKLVVGKAGASTSSAWRMPDAKPTNLDVSIDAVAKGESRLKKDLVLFAKDVISIDDDDDEEEEEEVVVGEDEEEEEEEIEIQLNIDDDDEDDDRLVIDSDPLMNTVEEDVEEFTSNHDVLFDKYGKICEPNDACFRCPFCSIQFAASKLTGFVVHLLTELNWYRYQCDICGYKSMSNSDMKTHCLKAHSDINSDNLIKFPMEMEMEYWMQIILQYQAKKIWGHLMFSVEGEDNETTTHKNPCELCDQWFKSQELLDQHRIYHWGHPSYSCALCAKISASMTEVFEHARLEHPSSKSAKIDTFKSRPYIHDVLERLESIPAEDTTTATRVPSSQMKMFACTYCHERNQHNELEKHSSQAHPNRAYNAYQYICLECADATFISIKNVYLHSSQAHPERRINYCLVDSKAGRAAEQLKCSRCAYRSAQAAAMGRHVRKHLRLLECKVCKASFVTTSEARLHHAKEHPRVREAFEENRERAMMYEGIMKAVLAEAEGRKMGGRKKMVARKSTGAPAGRAKGES